jgi:hypothetical protein
MEPTLFQNNNVLNFQDPSFDNSFICGSAELEWVNATLPQTELLHGNPHHPNAATPSPTPQMGDLSDDNTESEFEVQSPIASGSIASYGLNFPFFGDHFVPTNFISSLAFPSNMVNPQATQMLAAPHPIKLKGGLVKTERMDAFPAEQVSDFKHVIYNLLVEFHNHPEKSDLAFVQPCTIEENGVLRTGFCFNQKQNPEKRLPELYAYHIRKARLELEDPNSIFIQDLYKFYLRASLELLSKYFEKRGKYTFLYEELPLFKPGCSLEEAEERIKNMRTRARMMKKRKIN